MSKNILCFLTVRPNKLVLNFYKKLKNEGYDVYVFIDDNSYFIKTQLYDELKIIKINNNICEDAGFKSSVLFFTNKSTSRDKALYYFCKNDIDYQYIWFIEEDVFIPNEYTIQNIDKKYTDVDLLVKEHDIIYEKQENIWHWDLVNSQIKIDPPYATSMICAIRCSKTLIKCINSYVNKYGGLFLDETLFNTIALHNNLHIKPIIELSPILFRHNWKKKEINENYLYHPIKSIDMQYHYRK